MVIPEIMNNGDGEMKSGRQYKWHAKTYMYVHVYITCTLRSGVELSQFSWMSLH